MILDVERISVPRPEEAEVVHSLRITLPDRGGAWTASI